MNMTGGTRPPRLNRPLHVPNVEHSLISVSGLCDDCHTVGLSEKNCVVKKNKNVIAIGERTGGMYLV